MNVSRPSTATLIAVVALSLDAFAQDIPLAPPGQRDFVLDQAGMVRPDDMELLVTTCTALLNDQAIPIVVATIESMGRYGGDGVSIETFAYKLFNQWEVGYESVNGSAWNKGILLLVSRDDRKARIELGAAWGREQDALCQQIMDEQIVPNFKDGAFSKGIVDGVNALDQMARGEPLPAAQRGSGDGGSFGSGLLGVLLLPFALIASLFRSIFGGRGSSGGGFSGGSFGGGFSGGGGATGSW